MQRFEADWEKGGVKYYVDCDYSVEWFHERESGSWCEVEIFNLYDFQARGQGKQISCKSLDALPDSFYEIVTDEIEKYEKNKIPERDE